MPGKLNVLPDGRGKTELYRDRRRIFVVVIVIRDGNKVRRTGQKKHQAENDAAKISCE